MAIEPLDRRNYTPSSQAALKYAINPDQRETLRMLEQFGWSLKFVRRSPGQRPEAWVYDPDHRCMGVIDPDGTLRERIHDRAHRH